MPRLSFTDAPSPMNGGHRRRKTNDTQVHITLDDEPTGGGAPLAQILARLDHLEEAVTILAQAYGDGTEDCTCDAALDGEYVAWAGATALGPYRLVEQGSMTYLLGKNGTSPIAGMLGNPTSVDPNGGSIGDQRRSFGSTTPPPMMRRDTPNAEGTDDRAGVLRRRTGRAVDTAIKRFGGAAVARGMAAAQRTRDADTIRKMNEANAKFFAKPEPKGK